MQSRGAEGGRDYSNPLTSVHPPSSGKPPLSRIPSHVEPHDIEGRPSFERRDSLGLPLLNQNILSVTTLTRIL